MWTTLSTFLRAFIWFSTSANVDTTIAASSYYNSTLCASPNGASPLLRNLMQLYKKVQQNGFETTRVHVMIDRHSGEIVRPEDHGQRLNQAANAYVLREQVLSGNATGVADMWIIYTSDTSFSDHAIRVIIETERLLNERSVPANGWRAFITRKIIQIRHEFGIRYAWRWKYWYETHFRCSLDMTLYALWRDSGVLLRHNALTSICV